MAQIALRDYLLTISTLIGDERHAAAIEGCRRSLVQFPRHIESYRWLGKALLEERQFSAATEAFQRVLSADPEDFIAYAGLGISYQEEMHLPEAIWHLERALELNPHNSAIQEELRKLYIMRVGEAPSRLNFSRGALARTYFHGELYQEAATELRAVLTEHPDRVDLQSLLAEVLWCAEDRVAAVEVCLALLGKLPNCIKSLAILAEAAAFYGQAPEAERYLNRLQALTQLDNVDIVAGSETGNPAIRAFRANPSFKLPEVTLIDEPDDLPVVAIGARPASPAADAVGPGSEPSAGGAPLAEDESYDFAGGYQLQPREAQLNNEVPDWLRERAAVAPDTAVEMIDKVPEERTGEDMPDRAPAGEVLDISVAMVASASAAGAALNAESMDEAEVLDWLKALKMDPTSEADDEILNWLQPLDTSSLGKEPASERRSWIKPANYDTVDTVPIQAQLGEKLEESTMSSTDLPDNGLIENPDEFEDAMAWLDQLAEQESAPDEGLSEEGRSMTGEPPDWLKAELEGSTTESDMPDWLRPLSEGSAESEMGELPDWLHPPAGEENDDLLAWLQPPALEPLLPASAMADMAAPAKDDEPLIESANADADVAATGASAGDQMLELDDDLSWLDQIAAGEGPPIEEPLTLTWPEDRQAHSRETGTAEDHSDDGGETDSVMEYASEPWQPEESDADWVPELPEDPDEAMAWLDELASQQSGSTGRVAVPTELPEGDENEGHGVYPSGEQPSGEIATPASWTDDVPENPEDALAWLAQLAALPDETPNAEASEAENVAEVQILDEPSLADVTMVETIVVEAVTLDDSSAPAEVDLLEIRLEEEVIILQGNEAGAEPDTIVLVDDALEGMPDDPDAAMAWLEQLADQESEGEWLAEDTAAEAPGEEALSELSDEPKMAQEGLMAKAQQAMANGDYAMAVRDYEQLVSSGENLPGLIADLQPVAAEHKQPLLYRVLGDAYRRNEQLQEALECYRLGLEQL